MTVTVHRLSLQFDADQVTPGNELTDALAMIDRINEVLQRYDPFGLGAQIIATRDEIEVATSDDDDGEAYLLAIERGD